MTSTNATCAREQEDGTPRDGGPGEPAGDFEDAAFDEQGSEKRTAPTNDSAMSREVYFVIRVVVNAALPGMRSTSERDGLAHLLAFVVPVDGVAQSVEFREQVVDVRVCGAVRRGVGIV